MTRDEKKRTIRRDFLISAVLIASGLAITGLSMIQLAASDGDVAQVNYDWVKQVQLKQPETSPSISPGNDNGPAESKPGGTRPTTPAPEPARPDADARKNGAKPALPAAPPEKMGAPVEKK
jgi:hypothetical protein